MDRRAQSRRADAIPRQLLTLVLLLACAANDRVNKFSFDATRVIQSPVTTTTADMIAGDDGWLFRTQVQIGF